MRRAALLSCFLLLVACATRPRVEESPTTFVLASTTSTQDSGLLDALTSEFEKQFPRWRVKVVAVGSGEAMDLGRRGDADVLLVHSPGDELEFMNEGRGIFRKPVMRNDFVIAGPADDLAAVGSSADVADAFARIARRQSRFVSRGDRSGTHRKELETWEAAGIRPGGDWYLESGQGMAETLTIASERGAYVLTDTATLTVMRSRLDLAMLFQGGPALVNPYSVIPVKEARRQKAALAFAGWITGAKGQSFIREFGHQTYRAPLFVPTASGD